MRWHSEHLVFPAAWVTALLVFVCHCGIGLAQTDGEKAAAPETTEQKVERLTTAMSQVQAQMDANQKLLTELQKQLAALQQQIAAEKGTERPAAANTENAAAPAEASTSKLAAEIDEIKERQAIDESQIATHELTKVETSSKYPLTVTGLILFNGFVNTRQVDTSAAPAYVIPGSGSTGFSLRQTVLGLDASGPHLMGAASHVDIRVDFFGNDTTSRYTTGVLRLRTAHASLKWPSTEVFVELDRSILEPNVPTSLLAVGQPELAWTGNLWTWNPQVGLSHQFGRSDSARIQAQAALIDPADPRWPGPTSGTSTVTLSEQSRWPGIEGRIAFLSGATGAGPEIGIGGYFSPHRTADGLDFKAWAGTADLRLPMGRHFEMTANAYRGQALGGLGGGGYVDYITRYVGYNYKETAQALDDVGGWAQLKARAGQRMEMNAGYGIDNPFVKEIRATLAPLNPFYPGLAKNRSYFWNAIYSPSSYLQFSLEYRRIWTNYAVGNPYFSDVIGLGAGYSF
jgi:hypothetical protein